jgi:p-hydroxybenzoate 3-monooxygenase
MVYGQTEVTKDLILARLGAGGILLFEAEVTALEGLDGKRPAIRYRTGGADQTLICDLVAGCDGFHGACRRGLPESAQSVFERVYPFGWLGILTHTRPVSPELIYASHERGFALFSMRSPTVSRLYIQCRPDEHLEDWPDERIWDELRLRVGPDTAAGLETGPSVEKGVTPMRSFVVEPMRFGRLFLAGDAAHIVPPTGAKGLNLAAADVRYLARAMTAFFRTGATGGLESYSATALRRVWKAQRFSWWMTSLLHRFPGRSPFDDRLQQAELDYLMGSTAAMTALAENSVGLPFD